MSNTPPVITVPDTPPADPDYNSFLQEVLAGTLPINELNFRLNAKDGVARADDGRAVVRGRNDRFVFAQNQSDGLRETRVLNEEQRAVVKEVAERKADLAREEQGLADTSSFLQEVLAGTLPINELNFRLNAKDGVARADDGRAVVRGRNDRFVFAQNQSDGLRETRVLNEEQRAVVKEVAERKAKRDSQFKSGGAISLARQITSGQLSNGSLLEAARKAGFDDSTVASLQRLGEAKGQSVDADMDTLIADFLNTGDDSALLDYVEDKRVGLADISDTAEMRRGINALESYAQAARDLSLRARFWEAAKLGTESATDRGLLEAFRVLEEFQPVLPGDDKVKKDLIVSGLKLRRDNFLLATYQSISGDTIDYELAAKLLKGIEQTTVQLGDAESFGRTLQTIAESAYSAEITSVFGDLLSRVQLDRTALDELRKALSEVKLRPPVGDIDFIDKFTEARESFESILTEIENLALQREIVEIKKRFVDDPDISSVVDDIIDLPEGGVINDALRQELINELSFLTSARKGLDSRKFEDLTSLAVRGIRRARGQSERLGLDLTKAPEKRNIRAVSGVVRRFKGSIVPLFETIRGGSDGSKVLKYISPAGTRSDFVQNIERLEEQRALSETERAYLESVELLSIFNPHLVALARERPELTSLYLEQYFKELDRTTREALEEDIYVPLVQIGLGPNGVASAGELNRSNPELAEQTLYIDAAELPGGPFGQVKGLGWSLNSANSIGRSTNVLPDQTDSEAASAAVRSFGSPLVMYPGERRRGEDTRAGSINSSVDYLLNPDNVSTTRYPDNADLARVLQLQAAMLTDHLLLSTRVTKVEPIDDDRPGNKRVTLEYQTETGETIVKTIRTDGIIISSGLGEPNYGINLPGSRAEQILNSSANTETADGFPILTDTLGAFEVLSSPETEEQVAPQGTVVIYGGGNSADVLIEYLGRQFESGNPALDGVEKVYVITGAPLSARPRYAAINDLKARGGKQNFLQIIDARVADVSLSGDRAILLDQAGNPITTVINGQDAPIMGDHIIAASGFRPELDEVFAPLLSEGESLDRRRGTESIVLPTNPSVSVGDVLASDPDVILVGTASRDGFGSNDKVLQLPKSASVALRNNGVENAVAIGFRTPDTRAAVRLRFGDWSRQKGELKSKAKEKRIINSELGVDPSESREVVIGALPATRRTVPADADTLTALLLDELNGIELANRAQSSYGLTIALGQGSLIVRPDSYSVPAELLDYVATAASDPYFQAYALKAIRTRRSSRGKITIELSFSNGKLRLRDKPDSGATRTYAEVT